MGCTATIKFSIYIILALFQSLYQVNAQVVTRIGFEQDEKRILFSKPDSIAMKMYADSLLEVYKQELLTGYIYSNLHELIPVIEFEYYIDNGKKEIAQTDAQGRFFVPRPDDSEQIIIRINNPEYDNFDTTYIVSKRGFKFLPIELSARYKLLIRGRVFAGNMPIENVHVSLSHQDTAYSTKTQACYTDDENYWNCLYLGMFKQALVFDNPDDSIYITLQKEGFKSQVIPMILSDYDGKILLYRLRYTNELPFFPTHNVGFKAGFTFRDTWDVELFYIRQLQLGGFQRLGVGVSASMLMNQVSTEHATFDNLGQVKATENYTTGVVGPLVNYSITNPLNRKFNLYTGAVAAFIFPEATLNFHPYIGGKYYLDMDKALCWEVRYVDYSIDVSEYTFNAYGNAERTQTNKKFQMVSYNLGLLVSF
jgi:hypothetical protein